MRQLASITVMACIIGLGSVTPAPSQTSAQTLEDASKAFVRTYMERWSSSNSEAMAFMEGVFPGKMLYFDRELDHSAVMQAKRRFAERWPLRRFDVRGDSFSATCDSRRLCTVWGLVDWLCRSPERHAHAAGTSVFAFQVQDGQAVVDEDGFVIARGRVLPRTATAAPASRTYSNEDIGRLRRAFYDDSADPNWIANWLAAQEAFSGVARSLGQAGVGDLTDADGSDIRYPVFQADQGPIACMTAHQQPLPAPGALVRLRGTVAIFIDETMYLSDCSFS